MKPIDKQILSNEIKFLVGTALLKGIVMKDKDEAGPAINELNEMVDELMKDIKWKK